MTQHGALNRVNARPLFAFVVSSINGVSVFFSFAVIPVVPMLAGESKQSVPLPVLVGQWQTHVLCAVI